MERKNISSGTTWEDKFAYSRAVRTGNTIEVSGTTAVISGKVASVGDAYGQAVCILQKIEQALNHLGASRKDVIRTRMYVTDIGLFEEVGRAHGEFFAHVKPATTLVEVGALVDPDMLVEIEATAVLEH
ncbi:MAG: RidA family protein [Saprospiraceae bacterium]|nr:RidA family protein [Saprospiraceae bacterium]